MLVLNQGGKNTSKELAIGYEITKGLDKRQMGCRKQGQYQQTGCLALPCTSRGYMLDTIALLRILVDKEAYYNTLRKDDIFL